MSPRLTDSDLVNEKITPDEICTGMNEYTGSHYNEVFRDLAGITIIVSNLRYIDWAM